MAEGIRKKDERRAQRDIEQIILGELIGVPGRAEQAEQRVHKQDDEHAGHHAESKRRIAAERGRRCV